ncbi:hypothetical protein GCM10028807_58580 [Spirosoma daeguense]
MNKFSNRLDKKDEVDKEKEITYQTKKVRLFDKENCLKPVCTPIQRKEKKTNAKIKIDSIPYRKENE